MVLGVAGAAFADSVDYPGANVPPWTATNGSDPVEVRATVNPKITLTVDTDDASQSIEWLGLDPGTTSSTKRVDVFVDSNKQFDLDVTEDVSAFTPAEITLVRTVADTADVAKGEDVAFADDYYVTTTWNTAPGTYKAYVTYTVTQD
jgi:hypothetical protein